MTDNLDKERLGIGSEDQWLEIAAYEEKIRRLQDYVASLRMSRRILMSLLEQVQEERNEEVGRLQRENLSLRKRSNAYATKLWEQNCRLLELEKEARS